jgi:glycine cleavage system H lipoate-binding protein
MVAILVILTVAIAVSIRFVADSLGSREAADLSPGAAGEAISSHPFVHGGHAWAKLETSGEARVGIDHFLLKILGGVDRVYLPEPGQVVRQGEKAFAVFKNGKKVSLAAPIDGVVASVNPAARLSGPAGEGLYGGNGWLFSIRPRNLSRGLANVKTLEAASSWFDGESRRFASFLVSTSPRFAEVGATLQDGGNYPAGILDKLSEEQVRTFEREFLA